MEKVELDIDKTASWKTRGKLTAGANRSQVLLEAQGVRVGRRIERETAEISDLI